MIGHWLGNPHLGQIQLEKLTKYIFPLKADLPSKLIFFLITNMVRVINNTCVPCQTTSSRETKGPVNGSHIDLTLQ